MGKQLFFMEKIPKTGAIPNPAGFHLPSRPTVDGPGLSLVGASTVALGASTGFNFQRLTDLGWLSWETFPRDPGLPKLRMVVEAKYLDTFGGDCTPPCSSSENMTIGS